jgi:hypothetical protein
MATKILRSRSPFAYHLDEYLMPDGTILPAMDLPKEHYRPGEVYINGPRKGYQARPILECDDLMQARIAASPLIVGMFQKGFFEFIDTVPESMQTAEDLIGKLRAENSDLKRSLATHLPLNPLPDDDQLAEMKKENEALKERLSNVGLKGRLAAENLALKAQVEAAEAATAKAPEEIDSAQMSEGSAREQLMAMPYKDLQAEAAYFNLSYVGVKRVDLVTQILAASVYQEAPVPDDEEETADPSGPDE